MTTVAGATLGIGTANFIPAYGLVGGAAADTSLVRAALSAGVRYLDTAAIYGDAELALGEMHSEIDAAGARVATKVGVTVADTRLTAAQIVAAVEASLTRLRMSAVDTVMWHSASRAALESSAVADAAAMIHEQGLARRVGASTYGTDDACLALAQPWCGMVQIEYSLLNPGVWTAARAVRRPDQEVVVRSVLCKGLLTDRWREAPAVSGPIAPRLEALEALAGSWQMPLSHLATRFALDTPGLDVVLVGVGRPEELSAAISARDLARLTSAQWNQVAAFDASSLDVAHPERWTHV